MTKLDALAPEFRSPISPSQSRSAAGFTQRYIILLELEREAVPLSRLIYFWLVVVLIP
jgi:hypothetical protein